MGREHEALAEGLGMLAKPFRYVGRLKQVRVVPLHNVGGCVRKTHVKVAGLYDVHGFNGECSRHRQDGDDQGSEPHLLQGENNNDSE